MSRFSHLAAVVLAFAAVSSAQTLTSSITGIVTDSSGASIPSAGVSIRNPSTGVVVWKGTTDDSGLYQAPSIPVGVYDILVEAAGFKRAHLAGITVQVDQRIRVDAQLQPGEVTESITVTAESIAQLQTETSYMGDNISTTQVKDMPLPSRAVLNLLTLVGGTSSGGSGSGINASQLSINGSRTLNSEFTVDGVSVVSGSTGGLTRLPSVEAIRELKVLTSGYSAEYGRTSGGSVNAVVDSGSNDWHGGVYYFFRNEAANANDYFRNARGESRQRDRWNQFGAKLSGPLTIPKLYNGRDRTFFFFNYEGLRRTEPVSILSTVPDEQFRMGDFSRSPVVVSDPLGGAPFAGNRLPGHRIDPAARRIMGLFPAPNTPGILDSINHRFTNNFVNNAPVSPVNDEFTVRADHSLGHAARLFGRLTQYSGTSPSQSIIPGPLDPAVGATNLTGWQTSLGWTHTWTPTLLTEVNLGFMRDDPRILPPSLGVNVAETLGIERSVGGATPRFGISGFRETGINTNTYRTQINNNYQLAATATKTSRGHLIKFGGQLRRNQFNVFNPGGLWAGLYNFNGELSSAARVTGNPVNALADFLLGMVKTSEYELPQPPTGRRNHNWALFVQDDWKLRRNLTLNLGLRYEYESPMTMSNDIYSRIDPTIGRLLVANHNASPSLNHHGDRLNLAPRVGFAWSLNEKTVVRSAFGMFFSQIFSNLGGIVVYPGFTVRQQFLNLGPGVAQPFRLSEGMPLLAVQNLNDPFFVERIATVSNPMVSGANFGEVNPLPYSTQWNFGIQRELPFKVIVDTSYVASRGVNLPLSLPFNQVPYERGEEAARVSQAAFSNSLRPFPTVAGFSSFMHAGTSTYHSLQVRVNRQMARSLSLVANYTFSKSLDDGSGLFSFSQPNDVDSGQFINLFRRIDRAVSAFDRPHNFTAAMQYTTGGPKWLRGIQFSPMFVLRDGLPDTLNQNNLHPTASQLRPNVINDTSIYAPRRLPEGAGIRYLRPVTGPDFPLGPTGPLFVGSGATRRLVLPFLGPGTLGRNTVREPGEFTVDIAVARRFHVRERMYFTLRAEAFNMFNRANFEGPSTGLSVQANAQGQPFFNSPNFGLITAARPARLMQFVARFDF
jgi:outer membrane receptor protein involved in Fe transport